jgi:hypothetical protein
VRQANGKSGGPATPAQMPEVASIRLGRCLGGSAGCSRKTVLADGSGDACCDACGGCCCYRAAATGLLPGCYLAPTEHGRVISPPPLVRSHCLHRAMRSTAASPEDASLPCTPCAPSTVTVLAKLLATSPLAACQWAFVPVLIFSAQGLAASTCCWPALDHHHALQSHLPCNDSCPLSIVAQARARMPAAKFSIQPSHLTDI